MPLIIFFAFLFNIQPPTEIKARDNPNDQGEKILITWKLSEDDKNLDGYKILRVKQDTTEKETLGFVGKGVSSYFDEKTKDGVPYAYQILAVRSAEVAASELSNFAVSKPQWFNTERINVVIFTLALTLLVVWFITRAKKGIKLFIRKIPGLLAVEEAVGRATEMGKPILYVPGLSGMGDVATIASMNILGEVAKKIAQYETKLIVPNNDPIVYTVAREVVKEAYTSIGKPDAFNPDSVYFVTDTQFAFAAACDGIMVREKPATNFFIGYFFAESLILAETGAATGAIQIAGTDAIMQLPFFITACDYTLMGEELYAASAYLSQEPLLLGALKGQDYGKAIIIIILLLASLFALTTKLPILRLF